MEEDEESVDANDCCGNGCANCILNTFPSQIRNNKSKQSGKNALLTYRKYELVERIQLFHKILQLKFKLPIEDVSEALVLDIPSGHHVMMKAENEDCEWGSTRKTITRPYSPFNVDSNSLSMEILVNLSPEGKMSHYIQQLSVGDFVEFRGPVGSFYHSPNLYESLLIFTHGVAVAPVIRIIEGILDNEDDITRIHLNCCFSDVETILFRDKLHRYNNYWNFSGTIYLSHENCDKCGKDKDADFCPHFKAKLKYKENVQPHRLKEEVIVNILNKVDKDSCRIVICGSKLFEQFVTKAIDSASFNRQNISVL